MVGCLFFCFLTELLSDSKAKHHGLKSSNKHPNTSPDGSFLGAEICDKLVNGRQTGFSSTLGVM